jgi:hypothetical protein
LALNCAVVPVTVPLLFGIGSEFMPPLRGDNYFCRSRCLSSESYPTSPFRSHREEIQNAFPGSVDLRPWESRSEGTASGARRHVAQGLPWARAMIRPSCLTRCRPTPHLRSRLWCRTSVGSVWGQGTNRLGKHESPRGQPAPFRDSPLQCA